MINLKENIWIEGFDFESLMLSSKYGFKSMVFEIIYSGKTSEIPDKITNNCVEILLPIANFGDCVYRSYDSKQYYSNTKESIQSACPETYCIIFKK